MPQVVMISLGFKFPLSDPKSSSSQASGLFTPVGVGGHLVLHAESRLPGCDLAGSGGTPSYHPVLGFSMKSPMILGIAPMENPQGSSFLLGYPHFCWKSVEIGDFGLTPTYHFLDLRPCISPEKRAAQAEQREKGKPWKPKVLV